MATAASHIWGLKWSKLFLSLTPTSKQQDTLIACSEAVKAALAKDRLEDISQAEVINVGSLAKQTLSRGTNEIDVMVCFSSSITGENFDSYLLMLKKSLETNFKIPIEQNIVLLRDRIRFKTSNNVIVNVFPSKLFGDINLVQKATFLTADAVEDHVALISKQDFVYKDLVRVAKHWRDKHCLFTSLEARPSSTLLELIMFNAYSRYRDKGAPYAAIFKSFLKLIANYPKLGLISRSTAKSLGKMPIVQDFGNPMKNLAMAGVHWVEISQHAQRLITQLEMPDPLASSVTSTLKKSDLIRIIQLLTAGTETEEESSLTSRLLQQVVRLEDRIEELENIATTAPANPTIVVQESIPSAPPTPIVEKRGKSATSLSNSLDTSPDKDLAEQLQEQNKRLLKIEETAQSLSLYCSPKAISKKSYTEVSLSPPFDQRVYKKEFTYGGLMWQLQLYPKGKTDKERGYSSLFFKLHSPHIQDQNPVYARIEITSQLLNGTIQETFINGSTYGYAKAFDQKKLRAKVDFKLKISFPTPLTASEKSNALTDKAKRHLYL